ncbi:hypothetical protein HUW86_04200 [Fusobacterium sp. SB021]|uniref:hypothetical protein n=1 Tax=Fusobacterium sp. SB021 TaxID=2744227 RepID=UPI003CF863C9
MNSLDIRHELPYIPFGPFKIRLPFFHYKIEKVEFIQGLVLGVTGLSSVPYLMEYLGLPYELAWSCVIIDVFLYILHGFLGDPVVPGWITPTLPLTIIYLQGYEMGPERIQAMIALQILVGIVFIFMGITKMADRFVHVIPNSIKGGILLAAPITVMSGQLGEGQSFSKYPISIIAGVGLLLLISFSDKYQELRKNSKFLDLIAKYGNLFPYLLAMVVGLVMKEIATPVVTGENMIKLPEFSNIISQISIFGVGVPSFRYFIDALPLALVCYVIAFGDFITSETLIKEASEARKDEIIDFNSSRSNLVSGIRNIILGILAPFPPLSGPLWVGMTVSVSMRYKEGKAAMRSLLGGMASFRLATFFSVICVPVVMFFKPLFPVGASITLIFQAFVCARIGMDYCKTDRDKMIAGVMAAVLAVRGSAWALGVGIALNILLSNIEVSKD